MSHFEVRANTYDADANEHIVIIGSHEASYYNVTEDGNLMVYVQNNAQSPTGHTTRSFDLIATYAKGQWTSIQRVEQKTQHHDPFERYANGNSGTVHEFGTMEVSQVDPTEQQRANDEAPDQQPLW